MNISTIRYKKKNKIHKMLPLRDVVTEERYFVITKKKKTVVLLMAILLFVN